MSFRGAPRGRGTGANFGGGGGRGGGGGFGARRGGFQRDNGPPADVLEMGTFLHACEGEIVCESINTKIPYFNAPIYLQNKTSIGKVDEILGPINQVYFTIKPTEGIQATSFKSGDKFYIGGDKLLPLEKFLPKPKPPPGAPKPKRAGGARGGDEEASVLVGEVVVVEAVSREAVAVALLLGEEEALEVGFRADEVDAFAIRQSVKFSAFKAHLCRNSRPRATGELNKRISEIANSSSIDAQNYLSESDELMM
ncbi:hypothetical protein G7Y89_g4770 [Cudoniella acicularis]|uniref:H/ACA ribonucleoprotein complex subunit n=1 Tax=Cudoniella acicularis TaxID=354080 RepID=A0A8H4RQ36_9HELO|nr:hypothetical protein G7Y89_g4770 [Cudoniella acicularis]